MHNLTRYCFIPVNGPTILYEYFNCEKLSEDLNLIDEIRPAITWDYFSNGDQAEAQLKKWVDEIKDLSSAYFKSKKIAIDVLNGPAVSALNKEGIKVVDAKLILGLILHLRLLFPLYLMLKLLDRLKHQWQFFYF